jgi:ABC-type uncharacterized transport system permease subunit
MNEALSTATLALALILYAGSSGLFYLGVARSTRRDGRSSLIGIAKEPSADRASAASSGPRTDLAPILLAFGALGHAAYVIMASFVAHVCPIYSVHFILSVASLFATSAYLVLRRRFHIDALGLLVGPLGLAFLLGTYFLGKPAPEPKLSPVFIAMHVLSNLLGVALFLLAGGAAALYLVQERRLKGKKGLASRIHNLPPLDALDHAEHRFLIAGFPLLTLGIISGTFWAQKIEVGSPDDVMRTIFGYATWLLIAGVLLLRAAAGWRGRRAAYGTIAGLVCAAMVLLIYLVRPVDDSGTSGKRGALPAEERSGAGREGEG